MNWKSSLTGRPDHPPTNPAHRRASWQAKQLATESRSPWSAWAAVYTPSQIVTTGAIVGGAGATATRAPPGPDPAEQPTAAKPTNRKGPVRLRAAAFMA